ncbi:SDR family oxidoreductase [Teredinibacter turnerae]|uniref:SDR family oxidoreductase n=1 Tax=Teredinibacter turnerae TaxID=2426 RepID=UPI00035D90DF|nr:NAD(P)H-binding protein [Teredinibacter turnerae]
MNEQTILVIGKYGKTGARVEASLQRQGYNTRGVSRSTQPAFDWLDENTWASALAGITAAYVTFQPDLAVPGADEIMRNFVTAAKRAGVAHLVLLSGRGEPGAQRAEAVIQNSGLTWNIVRASWFAQNFSENFMLEGIQNGALVLPECNTPEPFIDIDDLADVAVAALTQPELQNTLFEVTGPRLMTFAECINEISNATGRNIQYLPVPLDTYIAGMQEMGLPEEYQWLLNELFREVFDGRNQYIADGVEQALGRPATDFSDYVKKTAASGVWNSADSKSA